MLIINNTSNPIYYAFELKYADKIISQKDILNKIQIEVINIEDYLQQKENLPIIENVEEQVMSCYILKNDESITSTIAGIVINPSFIERLSLSEQEIMACLAHEIGHIAFFFIENKESYSSFCQEAYADEYAQTIGLGGHLCSALNKLIKSELYCENLTKLIHTRIKLIKMFAQTKTS